jgi:hypothetical protein
MSQAERLFVRICVLNNDIACSESELKLEWEETDREDAEAVADKRPVRQSVGREANDGQREDELQDWKGDIASRIVGDMLPPGGANLRRHDGQGASKVVRFRSGCGCRERERKRETVCCPVKML